MIKSAAAVGLLLAASTAMAEIKCVKVETPLRDGPNVGSEIVDMQKQGWEVEVRMDYESNGFLPIGAPGSISGWILKEHIGSCGQAGGDIEPPPFQPASTVWSLVGLTIGMSRDEVARHFGWELGSRPSSASLNQQRLSYEPGYQIPGLTNIVGDGWAMFRDDGLDQYSTTALGGFEYDDLVLYFNDRLGKGVENKDEWFGRQSEEAINSNVATWFFWGITPFAEGQTLVRTSTVWVGDDAVIIVAGVKAINANRGLQKLPPEVTLISRQLWDEHKQREAEWREWRRSRRPQL